MLLLIIITIIIMDKQAPLHMILSFKFQFQEEHGQIFQVQLGHAHLEMLVEGKMLI